MSRVEDLIAEVSKRVADKRYYYSQNRENEFATDCSDLIIKSLKAIGVDTFGATYTGNMITELMRSNEFECFQFKTYAMKRGDILLKHTSANKGHTVLYIGDNQILHAKGKDYGLVKERYYANNYQYILRFKEGTNVTNLITIRKGCKSIEVGFLQLFLNKYNKERLEVDCDFGPKTEQAVKNFQLNYNLAVDGIVGVNTWSKVYSIMARG